MPSMSSFPKHSKLQRTYPRMMQLTLEDAKQIGYNDLFACSVGTAGSKSLLAKLLLNH
jgi:hypothetical protein